MFSSSDKPTSTPIDDLPEDRFVEGWTAIVGEPPSIMLDRHHEMIVVLVHTVPADPDDGAMFHLRARPRTVGCARVRPGP